MIEANKVKLGVFITLGSLLVLAGIFFFGLSQFFIEKVKIYSVFTDDIQGIGIGSPVKYYGVDFGQVTDLYICNDGSIEVQMDLYLGRIEKKMKSHFLELILNKETQDVTMQKEVDDGLRCALRFRGITGDKYVSLVYLPNTGKRENLQIDFKGEDIYYVPSVSSHVETAIDNISDIIYNLSEINFSEAINNLNNDLNAISELAREMKTSMNALDVRELSNALIETSNNIDQMAAQITTLCNNLNSNPSSIVWGTKQNQNPTFKKDFN